MESSRIAWLRIARDYQTVDQIDAAVRDRRPPVPSLSTPGYVAPRTPLEAQLAALWAGMLQTERVSVDADFFSIGGHSLLAVQLLSRVRDRFDVELSLDVVFGGRFTVAELARAIELAEIQRSDAVSSQLLAEIEGLSDEEALELLRVESNGSSGA